MFTLFYILWTLVVVVAAKIIVITAGSGGLVFSPDSVTTDVGDILAFHFVSKIYSVVSGNFSSLCVQSRTGFDSRLVTSVRFSPFLSLISSYSAKMCQGCPSWQVTLYVVRCLLSNSPNHWSDLVLQHSRLLLSGHGRRRQRSVLRWHPRYI